MYDDRDILPAEHNPWQSYEHSRQRTGVILTAYRTATNKE